MSISTLSLNNAHRATLMRLQTDLKNANTELTTERHADVGAALGRLTGTAVSYRMQETSIDAQLDTNTLISSRLELANDAMESVQKAGESLSGSLLSAEKYSDYQGLAKSALQQMQGAVNTSLNGLYVFGGQNAGVAPIKDVDAGIAAAKAKYDAFLTQVGTDLGKTITSANVPADALKAFLTTGYPSAATPTFRFTDTVGDPAFAGTTTPTVTAGTWSAASSANTVAAISKTETVETSVSANADAFRNTTAAYSMLAAIASSDLNSEARTVLTKQAAVTLKTGTDGMIALQATVGTRQARVDAANTALKQQKDIVNAAFTRLEGVDQTEAGLRVTQLETQLQASYTVAGRLQKLSILDYI